MDNAQWTQENGERKAIIMEKRSMMMMKGAAKGQKALNCPRCHSTNTKFCYYNNYSLTQPRYFCKTCRRYWTEGGTLRNVPVGGGSRKHSKKPSTTNDDNPPPPKLLFIDIPDLNPPPINNNIIITPHQNPNNNNNNNNRFHHQDLNLGFHHHQGVPPQFLEFPKLEGENVISPPPTNSISPHHHLSPLNFLRNGNNNNNDNNNNNGVGIRELNHIPFMAPNINNIISGGLDQSGNNNDAALFGGFSFQECKPSSSRDFSIDDHVNTTEESALMFTLGGGGGTRRRVDDDDHQQIIKGSRENINNNANGFWNGMLGGGGSW